MFVIIKIIIKIVLMYKISGLKYGEQHVCRVCDSDL